MNAAKIGMWLGAAGVGSWLAIRAYREWNALDLREKTVLVTGSSRGLGLVLARQLADQGARLVLCARDPDELERARAQVAERGAAVLAVPCDLTEPDQVRGLVGAAIDRFGAIDVLINNAGTINVGPLENMAVDDFREALAVNFWAALHTILEVLPGMRRRGQGRIVNISSVGGKVAVPHLAPYSASKFALVGLSEALRSELRHDGIVVTTIIPGLLRTGSPRNASFKGQHRAEYAWFSIGDSLPFASMAAETAARQIIAATRRGDAEVVLSLPAQAAILFHDLFPGLTTDLLAVVNQFLPAAVSGSTARYRGKDSASAWAPSFLTALSDRAAQRNNEMPPSERSNGWH